MNAMESDNDDELASMLAACDEAMAAGQTSVIGDGNGPPHDQARLEKDLQCIRMLRQVWPGNATNGNSVAAATPPPERLGRFRIERELGRGGFGIVYLAFDPHLARTVALKVPRPDVLATTQLRERFRHEARAAAALDHPNIVAVHETGETESVSYIASAYCRGVTLSKWLAEHPTGVPFTVAAELTAQLADGVAHAHSRDVLHRDLKPSNVIVQTGQSAATIDLDPTDAGCPNAKITDFGLARFLNKTDFSLTATGAILGTPNYLAPEQASPSSSSSIEKGDKRGVGPAVDVYGLGAILYEMLTGRAPFVADNALETLRQVRSEDPIAPRKLRSQVPRDLETICLKCLEKEPPHRYRSALELAADLRRFLNGEPILARAPNVLERTAKWAKRRPAVAALITAVVLVAAIGFAGVLWQLRKTADALNDSRVAHEATKAHLYLNQIARARHELVANHSARAERLLDETPAAARGWEWNFLKRRCQTNLYVMRGNGAPVQSVAYSPDGKYIASGNGEWYSGNEGELNLWDAKTGELVRTLQKDCRTVYSVAFRHDSQRLVSSCADGLVRIWDVATGQLVRDLPGHNARIDSVAYSADGKQIASGSTNGLLKLWDAEAGDCTKTLTNHRGAIWSVTFSPDGKYIASADRNGIAHLWDVIDAKPIRSLGSYADIRAVAFSPDSTWLNLATYSGQIVMADLLKPNAPPVIHHPNAGPLLSLVTLPNGTLAWSSREGHIRISNQFNGKDRYVLPGRDGWAYSVAISPDGRRLASGGTDGTVRVCDATVSEPDPIYLDDGCQLPGMMFDRAGVLFALGGWRKNAVAWEVEKSQIDKKVFSVPGLANPSAIAGSQDGKLLSWISKDNQLHVRLRDGVEDSWSRAIANGPVTGLAFSADNRWIAWGENDGTIHHCDALTGEFERVIGKQGVVVTGVAFHPDGRALASAGDDGSFCIWDLATGCEVTRFSEPKPDEVKTTADNPNAKVVTRIWFSPDGRRLAAANASRPLEIWDVAAGRVALILDYESEGASSAAWSLDGQKLAVATGKRVKVWDASEQSLETRRRATVDNELDWHRTEVDFARGRDDWYAVIYHVSKLIDAEPNKAEHFALRGIYRVRAWEAGRGDLASAAADLARAAELKPDDIYNWYWQALVAAVAGNHAKYEAICRDLLERFGSNDKRANANLVAWVLSMTPLAASEASKAVSLADSAAKKAPNDANANFVLAAAQYRAGQHQDAKRSLERAMQLRQEEYVLDWLFMAMICQRLDRPDEAKSWLHRAEFALDRTTINQPPPGTNTNMFWYQRVLIRLLRDEAQAVVNPHP